MTKNEIIELDKLIIKAHNQNQSLTKPEWGRMEELFRKHGDVDSYMKQFRAKYMRQAITIH